MKTTLRNALCSLMLLGGSPAGAQIFDVDTLHYKGDPNKYINLVIVGDGYTVAQIPTFITNSTSFKNYFLTVPPFSSYQNYFNVFIIKVPSTQTGVKHPNTASDCAGSGVPVSNPTNYFGTTFDYAGIHRLVVPTNNAALSSVLANNFPNYDQVFILANSTYYGGSGGSYATATLNGSSNEIAAHEIGHSFSSLADEYWAGPQYAAEKANMTQNNNPATVKWKNWIGAGTGIGIYSHPGTTWYKPHQSCKMQFLGQPFCSVCQETIVERIHTLVNPVLSYAPASANVSVVSGPSYTFALTLINPNPNTLKREWRRNGTLIATNVDQVVLTGSSFPVGSSTLTAKVVDTTSLSRSDTHPVTHIYTVTWNVTRNSLVAPPLPNARQNHIRLNLYPNPADDYLNIDYSLEQAGRVRIDILSADGRLALQVQPEAQQEGSHSLRTDLSTLTAGTYIVQLQIDGTLHTEKIVVQ